MVMTRPLRSSAGRHLESFNSLADAQRAHDTVQPSSSSSAAAAARVTRSNKLLPLSDPGPLDPQKRNAFDLLRPYSTTSGRKRSLVEANDAPQPRTQHVAARPLGDPSKRKNTAQRTLRFQDDDSYAKLSNVDGFEEQPATKKSHPLKKSQSSQDKRTLRSQDGRIRPKSDLSIYFPNFDDIINDTPKDDRRFRLNYLRFVLPTLISPELLSTRTLIHVIDKPTKTSFISPKYKSKDPLPSASEATTPQNTVTLPLRTATSLNRAQFVDLSSFDRVNHNHTDPLDDDVYCKAHRRAERKEKQLRNIERERGMHEKHQLERLLEGLQGPDWLRVMGISGITSSEKKDLEPKRDYFTREVRYLINKFILWKEEEKRLRSSNENPSRDKKRESVDDAEAKALASMKDNDVKEPAPNDLDAWASRQLQEEASIASTSQTVKEEPAMPDTSHVAPKPFTSFYSKQYLRAAALGKHRHGRNATAFGVPLPDVPQRDFSLSEAYLTEDIIIANARKRRRLKREER